MHNLHSVSRCALTGTSKPHCALQPSFYEKHKPNLISEAQATYDAKGKKGQVLNIWQPPLITACLQQQGLCGQSEQSRIHLTNLTHWTQINASAQRCSNERCSVELCGLIVFFCRTIKRESTDESY